MTSIIRSLVRAIPLVSLLAAASGTIAVPRGTAFADASVTCATTPLAEANPYGAFILNDASLVNSDVEGPLAVGGNATLSGFNIGGSTRAPVAGPTGIPLGQNGKFAILAVGGNVHATNGSVAESLQYDAMPLTSMMRWGAFYGGTAMLTNVVGSFVHQASPPVAFAQAATDLPDLSTYYGTLPATPLTRDGGYSGVAGQAGLNVFTVSASDIAKTGLFAISAPSNATVLINVMGTTASIANANFASLQGGIDAQHVLFNFPNATTLSVVNVGISGSLLAPHAALSSLNNEITGAAAGRLFHGANQPGVERRHAIYRMPASIGRGAGGSGSWLRDPGTRQWRPYGCRRRCPGLGRAAPPPQSAGASHPRVGTR